jgi:hypothetical protein
MGCTSHRLKLNDEEAALAELERELNWHVHSAVGLDRVLRKHSYQGQLIESQFTAASSVLRLKITGGTTGRIAAFYSDLKHGDSYSLNKLLILGILLGAGTTAAKAELLFEVFDHESSEVLKADNVKRLVSDLYKTAVHLLPTLLGTAPTSAVLPSAFYYIDRLRMYADEVKTQLEQKLIGDKQAVTKADFKKEFEGESLSNLLSSSGFRLHCFKHHQSTQAGRATPK